MIKETLLVKDSRISSIGFDFEKNRPYIQMYKKKRKPSSYSTTFFLSNFFLGFIGITIEYFFEFPVLISLILATLTGIVTGKLTVYLTVTKSFGEKNYDKVEKRQIEHAIKNKNNLQGLRIAKWCLVSLLVLYSLIMLLGQSEMPEGNFIATIMLVFGVTYIEVAVHPGRGIRAIEILNRQLKEGRLDVE